MKIRITALMFALIICLSAVFTGCVKDETKNPDTKQTQDQSGKTSGNDTVSASPSGSDKTTDSASLDSGNTTEPISDSSVDTGNVTVPSTDENGYVPDNIDDSKFNYDGKVFTILAWQQSTLEYSVDTTSGDNIETAIFSRNATVESRLGVELKYEIIPGNSGNVDTFINTTYASISTNTHAYDAVASYTRCAGSLATKLAFMDLYNVENLNFDNPWWPSSLVEMNTISDKMYFVSGDIATSLIYQMIFFIYNNYYGTELGVENPQELALDGKWTLAELFELCDRGYEPKDESDQKSVGDRFGIFLYSHPYLDMFYMGAGLSYVSTTNGGLEISSDFAGEKSIQMLTDLQTRLKSDNWFYTTSKNDKTIRTTGNSLMYNVNGAELSTDFRAAEFSYSIMPGPKYDLNQKNYYTAVGFPHSMYSVPVDASDPAMSGVVLECLASESYRQVTPELFDKSFKSKYAPTEEDAEILGIIRDSVAFDIGRIFFEALGGDETSPIRMWRNILTGGTNRLASYAKKYTPEWNGKLAEIVKTASGSN